MHYGMGMLLRTSVQASLRSTPSISYQSETAATTN